MRFLFIVTFVAILLYNCCDGLRCICERDKCEKDLSNCSHGIVKDACSCCDVCAKGPGEECGGDWDFGGKCGQGFICVTNKAQGQRYGKCRKA